MRRLAGRVSVGAARSHIPAATWRPNFVCIGALQSSAVLASLQCRMFATDGEKRRFEERQRKLRMERGELDPTLDPEEIEEIEEEERASMATPEEQERMQREEEDRKRELEELAEQQEREREELRQARLEAQREQREQQKAEALKRRLEKHAERKENDRKSKGLGRTIEETIDESTEESLANSGEFDRTKDYDFSGGTLDEHGQPKKS